jgi:short-subunit dehydrogenase
MSGTDFAGRYGPWAVVAGASDGVGAAFARAMGGRGVNVVLLARRQAVLDEVAAEIRAASGVETRVGAIDLSAADAMDRIADLTAGLEVGMIMYNAGADPTYEPFLAQPVDNALMIIHRNCVTPTQMCHHFAQPMVDRGRGGIILVSSGAAFAGFPNVVAYSASKAFDMVLGEALWSEIHRTGVDVLSLVLGYTDTPAQRRLMVERGALPADDTAPIPGAASPEDVVDEALANLTNGPTWIPSEDLRQVAAGIYAISRGDAVRMMTRMSGAMDSESEPAA